MSFTATSFQINKVSEVGVYSPRSIIEANGVIYFWGITGIYSITPDPRIEGVWNTNNLTLDTIQRLFNSLPDVVKKGARGYYDLNTNTARWLYASDSADIIGNPVDILPPAVPVVLPGPCSAVSPYVVTIPGFSEIRGRVSDGTTLWRIDTSNGHIYGIRITDGVQTDDINLPTLLGRAYTTYTDVKDLRLGTDGTTLFMNGAAGFVAGQCALLKIDTVTPAVTTFGVYPPNTYSGARLETVPTSGTVWIAKGASTIAAITQTTLVESFTVSVTWGAAGWVYISALDEVWVHKAAAHTFEIYNGTTGAFIASTVASAVNPFDMHYDATSGLLVVTGGTGMEIWDTVTRTVTGYIDMSASADIYRQGVYIPGANEIVAYKYIGSSGDEVYVFINATTLVETETFIPSLISPTPTAYSYTGITVVDRCNIMLELTDTLGAEQLYRTTR